MVSFKSLLTVCSAVLTVMAMPELTNNTDHELLPRMVYNSSITGYYENYFYLLWMGSDYGATMIVENGQYDLFWSSISGGAIGGLGWNPGSSQIINYNGSFNFGNTSLSVYGWTTNPLIEYSIVESYGSYNPGSGATLLGTVTSDGGTYDIYHTVRVDRPSIIGTATFDKFWSVRQSHRVSGSVNVGNHFRAWQTHGLTLGTHNYQILATEGYQGSGSSSFTVSSKGPA